MILVTGSAGYIGSHIIKLFDINKITYKNKKIFKLEIQSKNSGFYKILH